MLVGLSPPPIQNRPHAAAAKSGGSAGFTIVELLVVIGVIAVIAALLLPSLGRAREKARQVACVSNERQIYAASLAFAADNDGFLFRPAKVWEAAGTEVNAKCIFAMKGAGIADLQNGALWRYVDLSVASREALVKCPSDFGEPWHYGSYDGAGGIRNFSYSLHSRMVRDPATTAPGVLQSIRLRDVKLPQVTVMMWEEIGPNASYCVDLYHPRRWDDQPSGRHVTGSSNTDATINSTEEKKYL